MMRGASGSPAGGTLLTMLMWPLFVAASLYAQGPQPTSSRAPSTTQTPPSRMPSSIATPTPPAAATPQPTPMAQPTPFQVPSLPGPAPVTAATPSPGASPSPVAMGTPITQNLNPLTLDEALRLANLQASSFQQATFNERIAAEDVKQAQAAFLPKVSAPLSYIYTSPALGQPAGTPRAPSFIANNAISEYQALVNVS